MSRRPLAALIPPPTQELDDDVVLNSCDEDEDLEPLHEVTNGAGPSRPTSKAASGLISGKAHLPSNGTRMPQISGPSVQATAQPQPSAQAQYEPVSYFSCQWRKFQTKKHKTWDGDAYLRVQGGRVAMLSENSERMGATGLSGGDPVPGCEFKIGPYDVEVDAMLTEAEFKRATTFLNRPQAVPVTYTPSTFKAPFKAPAQVANPAPSSISRIIASSSRNGVDDDLGIDPQNPVPGPSGIKAIKEAVATARQSISEKDFYAPKKKAQKIVIGEKSNKQRTTEWNGALHDPNAEGAVVMQRPPQAWADKKGTETVDVVLDPMLSKNMRPHQKEGVKFMYSCVMGLTGAEARGCILADEMGLGKTLQTIALIYTLLHQSPFANEGNVIGKALVVCPVSLVENWRAEFRKWVSTNKITVIVGDGSDSQTSHFVTYPRQQVLIIGYEKCRKIIDKLSACVPPIDLIVCDEGHRLKSKDNKTTKMFESLRTRRRLILSGTPLQNDLSEWHAMVSFVCPGILGKWQQFVKQYERPILKGRAQGASDEARVIADTRFEELSALSKEFVLRRESKTIQGHLPPKHEYVVFIAPTIWQLKAFAKILNPEITAKMLRGEFEKQPLGYIDLLRKISNTPTLLRLKKDDETSRSEHLVDMTKAALKELPQDMNIYDTAASGKFSALDQLLHAIDRKTKEKVIIVSNWTSTLDIIEWICKKQLYHTLRLDGTTPPKLRQDLVNRFNRQDKRDSFIFLLSAKAGGTGLNLHGASRLILFDSDWNPSTDLQAMARIHRDGQKHPVFIYRFLTTNSIDEKIYQRQITKLGLSDKMLDQGSAGQGSKDSFSLAELKDIFRLKLHTDGCQTHDLLCCKCIEPKADDSEPVSQNGMEEEEVERPTFTSAARYDPEPTAKMRRKAAVEQQEKLAALKEWTHFDGFDRESFHGVKDDLLYQMMYDAWTPSDTKASTNKPSSTGSDSLDAEDEDDIPATTTSDPEEEDKPKKKPRRVAKPAHGSLCNGLDDLFNSDNEDVEGDYVVMDSEDEAREETLVDPPRADNESGSPISRISRFAYNQSSSPSKAASSSSDGPPNGKERASRSTRQDKGSDNSPRERSDGSYRHRSAKRQSNGTAKSKPKPKSKDDDFCFGKKHDLREVAEAGQAGRITFVFERISQAAPLQEVEE